MNLQNPDMHLTTETQTQSYFIFQFCLIWNYLAISTVYLGGTGVHVALSGFQFTAKYSVQKSCAKQSFAIPTCDKTLVLQRRMVFVSQIVLVMVKICSENVHSDYEMQNRIRE